MSVKPTPFGRSVELSLLKVVGMTDGEVFDLFCDVRWADNGGDPYCPRCPCRKVYALGTRLIWRCARCRREFSVTSGTCFASRKLSLKQILLAVTLFLMGKKGVASLQVSRMLDVEYKTAYVLTQKIRQVLAAMQTDLPRLDGEVEVDGAFFGGHLERFNKLDRRTGRQRVCKRFGERRVVVVLRQRRGRTLTWVGDRESGAIAFVKANVKPGTTIHADGGRAWNSLGALFDLMRVNHDVSFSDDGACTNRAESFFSLLRRKQVGVHHRMSGRHLHLYAAEMAWRNDHNRVREGVLAFRLLRLLLTRPMTGEWVGYWQGAARAMGRKPKKGQTQGGKWKMPQAADPVAGAA